MQVLTTLVFFLTQQRGIVNHNLSQGHLSLSGFQLRGHAMFSGLDRPPDCETLEYAWLVEIQLGILSGRLTMPQVIYVVKPSCTRQNNYRTTVLIFTLSCLRSICYVVQLYCLLSQYYLKFPGVLLQKHCISRIKKDTSYKIIF